LKKFYTTGPQLLAQKHR